MRYVDRDGVALCTYTPAQEKLLTEASMMIPDTKARLATAVNELQAFLVCQLQHQLQLSSTQVSQDEVHERIPGAEELDAAAMALQSSQAVLAEPAKEN